MEGAHENPDPAYDTSMTNIGPAVLLGAALIALSIAIAHRYEVSTATSGDAAYVWRFDQWTGGITLCAAGPSGVSCSRVTTEKPK